MKFKFTQVLNTVTGKMTYFFSHDGCFPVDEDVCPVQTLQAELASRQINNVNFGLYTLGNNQCGCYAESKTPIMH